MHTRSEIAKRSEQIPEKQYVRSSSLLLDVMFLLFASLFALSVLLCISLGTF